MFTFAQQSPAARRLIGLAIAGAIAAGTAGTAGSLAAATDAHAMPCQRCVDEGDTSSIPEQPFYRFP
jgi:hypothetical protein